MLKDFAQQNAKHPLCANARAQWASILLSQNDLESAYEIALQGKNAFPDSIGGKLCHNLIENITAKAVNVSIERVWNNPAPNIRVRYKNISKMHFRIVQADWQKRMLEPNRWRADQITEIDRVTLFGKPPVKAWAIDLEPTTDYQEATHDLAAPLDLKPGYYFLLYSINDQFNPANNQVGQLGACELWVSKLGIVQRLRNYFDPMDSEPIKPAIEGLVVDNQTGEPIAGANVQAYLRNDRNPGWTLQSKVQSDATGLFQLSSDQGSYMLLVEHGDDRLSTHHESYQYAGQPSVPDSQQIALFTDRSVYRPGQTVSSKVSSPTATKKTTATRSFKARKSPFSFKTPTVKSSRRSK